MQSHRFGSGYNAPSQRQQPLPAHQRNASSGQPLELTYNAQQYGTGSAPTYGGPTGFQHGISTPSTQTWTPSANTTMTVQQQQQQQHQQQQQQQQQGPASDPYRQFMLPQPNRNAAPLSLPQYSSASTSMTHMPGFGGGVMTGFPTAGGQLAGNTMAGGMSGNTMAGYAGNNAMGNMMAGNLMANNPMAGFPISAASMTGNNSVGIGNMPGNALQPGGYMDPQQANNMLLAQAMSLPFYAAMMQGLVPQAPTVAPQNIVGGMMQQLMQSLGTSAQVSQSVPAVAPTPAAGTGSGLVQLPPMDPAVAKLLLVQLAQQLQQCGQLSASEQQLLAGMQSSQPPLSTSTGANQSTDGANGFGVIVKTESVADSQTVSSTDVYIDVAMEASQNRGSARVVDEASEDDETMSVSTHDSETGSNRASKKATSKASGKKKKVPTATLR